MGRPSASSKGAWSQRMRICKVIVSLCISFLLMAVIFVLSEQSSGESGSLSDAVARMLASLLLADFDSFDPLQQAEIIQRWSWPVRKTAHATEYACLGISLCASCWQVHALMHERADKPYRTPRAYALTCTIAFAIAFIYACSDEVHQLFIDGRAGQFSDVLVDASGALVGCILMYVVFRAFFSRHSARSA